MKAKRFKIKIQSMEAFKDDFRKAWRAAERAYPQRLPAVMMSHSAA